MLMWDSNREQSGLPTEVTSRSRDGNKDAGGVNDLNPFSNMQMTLIVLINMQII